jgi:hypothetical protein
LGALARVTSVGGALEKVAIIFDNFKIVGFPIEGTNMALLLTVEPKLDSEGLKTRVRDFVSYWLKVNNWVE